MKRYEDATWFKSTFSGGDGNCLEAAFVEDGVAVRHSKHRDGPVLLFTDAEWAAFLSGAKGGQFDRL